ncbi:cephalosporin hydroxylase family protein [Gammaproteobacteria bacterium]|nr:cephalosporin hydroxylase family protein [Gammaproteobacteria bacterium]
MSESEKFSLQVDENIQGLGTDQELQGKTMDWMVHAGGKHNYSYNFSCLGRPIIQFPQDMVALQELIWSVKPDLIVETGIAHGGSLILSASMLALLDYCDAVEAGSPLDPKTSKRQVVGIDIDIRAHNESAIKSHPMFNLITMLEGSAVEQRIIEEVHDIARNYNRILVILDSNHTHEHVLAELNAYASLVSTGSYCVVFDTLVEDVSKEYYSDRPWGPGNSPKTAVWEYLESHPEFTIDKAIEHKLLITVAPDGYLKRL